MPGTQAGVGECVGTGLGTGVGTAVVGEGVGTGVGTGVGIWTHAVAPCNESVHFPGPHGAHPSEEDARSAAEYVFVAQGKHAKLLEAG